MTVGEKIKSLRLQHAMTMEEMSKALKTSVTQISKWEHDKAQPSAKSVRKIASLFKIDVKQLTKLYRE